MYNFSFRHGSKCAGIIAAKENNGHCGIGLAYNARIGGDVFACLFFFSTSFSFMVDILCNHLTSNGEPFG